MIQVSVLISNERNDVFGLGTDPTTVQRQLQCLIPEFSRVDAEVQANFWFSNNPFTHGKTLVQENIEEGMKADLIIVFLSHHFLASEFYSQRLRGEFIKERTSGLLLFVLRPCMTMLIENRLQLSGRVIKNDKDWKDVRDIIVQTIRTTKPKKKEIIPMTQSRSNDGNSNSSPLSNDDLRRLAEQTNQRETDDRGEIAAYANVAEIKRICDRAEAALTQACRGGNFHAEVMEVNYHGHLSDAAKRGHDMTHLENLHTLQRAPETLLDGVALGVWLVLTQQRKRNLRFFFYHDTSQSRMGRRCKIIIYV